MAAGRLARAILLISLHVPVSVFAQTPDAYLEFLTARRLEAGGDVEGALAALERAAAADPGSAELHAEMAAVHLRQNDLDAAERAAREALARGPDNVEAHRVLGLIYSAYADEASPRDRQAPVPDDVKEAIAHLEIVAATPGGATDINLQYNLGRLYLRSGAAAKAVETLTAVVDSNPYSIQARLALAQALSAAERHDEAADTLKEVADEEPRLSAALGQFYERAGRQAEAAEAYSRAVEANPRDVRSLFALARVYRTLGRHDKAIEALMQARARGSADASLDAFLVQAHLDAKRYEEAAVLAAEGQKRHRDDRRFTRLHARALFHTGAASRAIALLEAALRASPEDPASHLAMADLYMDAGRHADTLRTLEAAAQRFPADADVLNFFGYVLADSGERLDEAVRLVTRALEIDPGNPSYLDSLGWAYFKRGNLAEAEKYLAKAAGGLPENSVVQDHYGDLLARRGRWAEAIEAWGRALDGDGEDVNRAAIEKKIRDARSRVR